MVLKISSIGSNISSAVLFISDEKYGAEEGIRTPAMETINRSRACRRKPGLATSARSSLSHLIINTFQHEYQGGRKGEDNNDTMG